MEKGRAISWRAASLVWAAGFVVATVAMGFGMKLLFNVEDAYATARVTPPWFVLPAVPLCMFAAGGCVVASALAGIPAAPARRYRSAVTILRVIAVTIFFAVFMLLLFYLQHHSGNAFHFIWQVLTNQVAPV